MMSTPRRFLDAAAGLPLTPAAEGYLTAGLGQAWASPAGRHGAAQRSRAVLQAARAEAATVLRCRPAEIFVGPGPDLALDLLLRELASSRPGRAVALSAVERVSLLRAGDDLRQSGSAVAEVPVDDLGSVQTAEVPQGVGVAAVQAANRETGVRQNLGHLREHLPADALLLVDATAARCRADAPGEWDAIVLDPRQWGGPPGATIVGVRQQCGLPARVLERLFGDPPIALLAASVASWPGEEDPSVAPLAERLRAGLAREVGQVQLVGGPDGLPHIVNASILYTSAEELVDSLSAAGFAVASGSACTSDTQRPSHVLTAMGALTGGNIRVSLPPGCPEDDVADLLAELARLVALQRQEAGL